MRFFANLLSDELLGRQKGPAEDLALSAGALRQLNRLRLAGGRFVPGYTTGQRSSARRRPAADFREHRMYTPGDDVRFVDWRASARQEHVFIKQGEQFKDATVLLLLDTSASMGWGTPPKSRAALTLAAALGYLALAHGDRLIVAPLGENGHGHTLMQSLGPITGKGQFPSLLNYLKTLPFRGQVNLGQALPEIRRKAGIQGGLLLLFTDLLDEQGLRAGLGSLPAPTWKKGVLHLLHPEEMGPERQGDFEMHDIETGQKRSYYVSARALETYRQRFNLWRQGLESACETQGAAYSLIPTDWELDRQVLPHLRNIHWLQPI